MIGAYIWIDAQNFTSKIAPAQQLIALCCVNWKLVLLNEHFALVEFGDIFISQKHVIGVAELTIWIRARANFVGQHKCILHFDEGSRIC